MRGREEGRDSVLRRDSYIGMRRRLTSKSIRRGMCRLLYDTFVYIGRRFGVVESAQIYLGLNIYEFIPVMLPLKTFKTD